MLNINTLSSWSTSRMSWLLLAGSAFILEIIALYFQYGMGLEPCVMCIYQRTAIFGVGLFALIAAIKPHHPIYRVSGIVGVMITTVWGFNIAYEHVQMQNPDNFLLALSCEAFPNFPDWFAIHQWLPAIFEARGTCDTIDWAFMTLSMPQWMLVIFSTYLLAVSVVVLAKLIKDKSL